MNRLTRHILVILAANALVALVAFNVKQGLEGGLFGLFVVGGLLLLELMVGLALTVMEIRPPLGQALLISVAVCLLVGLALCSR